MAMLVEANLQLKPKRIRVLVLTALPNGMFRLNLEEEFRRVKVRSDQVIAEKKRGVGGDTLEQGVEYEFVFGFAVRVTDVMSLIDSHRPHIVSFAGHGIGTSALKRSQQRKIDAAQTKVEELKADGQRGTAEMTQAEKALSTLQEEMVWLRGGICLKGEEQQTVMLTPANLASIIKLTGEGCVRILFLNACYTAEESDPLVEVVPAFIGNNRPIGDEPAIEMSATMYAMLALGKSVSVAFQLGVIAAGTASASNQDIPVLRLRQDDIVLYDRNELAQIPAQLAALGVTRSSSEDVVASGRTDVPSAFDAPQPDAAERGDWTPSPLSDGDGNNFSRGG